MDNSLKLGVIGVGHLGKFHVQQINKIPNTALCGVYDIDYKTASFVATKHNTKAYRGLKNLLAVCDAVSVVVPTPYHSKIAAQAIMNNCHVFIEKPITDNINDAKKIIALAKKYQKKIQVGHIERFNPAYKAYRLQTRKPLFIECHRLSPFNIRGSDVPVVLDLMIHDIDLVLDLVPNKILNIHASGASIVSEHVDLANARILFQGGVTANLTASRVSTKQMRHMRVFEKNCYASLNLQEQTVKTLKINSKKKIISNKKKAGVGNALFWELESFVQCIISDSTITINNGEQGLRALAVAMKIQKIIEKQEQT